MNVLTYIAFFGLCIKAGAILYSYIISATLNPVGAKNLYNGMNLYDLSQYSFWHYTASVSFVAAVTILQAYVAYLLIKVLSTIRLVSPFTIEVAKRLERISYYIFWAWIMAVLHNAHLKWLNKRFPGIEDHEISSEFLFVAGVVFIIAQIFKKGVELQSENELTV